MRRKRYYRTDFLFPTTNYLIGAGSIMALMGNYYEFNLSETAAKADARALRSDWGTVGNDFCSVLELFEGGNKKQLIK